MVDLLAQAKRLSALYNFKPARSRGQNFLIRPRIYEQIIAAAELKKDDIVLEVGPGFGFLTVKLAEKVKKVIAVEVDKKLAEILEMGLVVKKIKNVEVINKDILKVRVETLPLAMGGAKLDNYKIVANLPYNITSYFLRKFLSAPKKPELMVLMLQKEVAERICAQPPQMSLLAVSVQFYAQPQIIGFVDRGNFWPQPEVDSAIIKIKIRSLRPKVDEKRFFQMVKFGFSAKRKMLKNNLAAGYRIKPLEIEKWLKLADFKPTIRAQELSLEDWFKLFAVLEKNML